MIRLSPLTILLLPLVALGIAACSSDDDEGATPTHSAAEPEVVSSDAPRAALVASAAPDAALAGQEFGFDLWRHLNTGDENLLISPYSVQVALAMTRLGAAGATRDQIEAVLRTTFSADFDQSMNALDQLLASRNVPEPAEGDEFAPPPVELSMANSLWGQRGYPFESPFLDALAIHYGAGMNLVDFVEATEAARDSINGWVSDRTRDRIPELINEGVLSADTRLVLVNALYLKAAWLVPFDPADTTDQPFHLLDGSTVDVPTMHIDRRFQYASVDGVDAVSLPYGDGSLSMLLLVPALGGLDALEDSLSPALLNAVDSALGEYQVKLALPKFEFRSPTVLNAPLQAMGMPTAFEAGLADFSGITTVEDLYISAVVHEAFISVDEEGTEAAAATAVIIDRVSASPPAELTVDRPFLFLIRDNATGAILFLGRVTNPAQD